MKEETKQPQQSPPQPQEKEKPKAKSISERVSDISKVTEVLKTKGHDEAQRIAAEIRKTEDISAQIASNLKEICRIESEISHSMSSKTLPEREGTAILKQLSEITASLTELRSEIAPDTGGIFVELLLGKMNVKLFKEGEKFAFKNEYEKFKRRSILPFMVLVLASFYFTHTAVLKAFLQLWSIIYFASLALRENILRANGSHIRRWWIVHHYLSTVLSFVILIWPADSETYQEFRPIFHTYTLFQIIVQYLQSQYQLSRIYKMVAMGKASPMDVTGDTPPLHSSSNYWAPNIIVLYPFVTTVQLMQLYCSYVLLNMSWIHLSANNWYIPVIGADFFVLAVGNLIATNKVYLIKWKEYRKTMIAKAGSILHTLTPSSSSSTSTSSTSTSSSEDKKEK